jgi:hypothetical protein
LRAAFAGRHHSNLIVVALWIGAINKIACVLGESIQLLQLTIKILTVGGATGLASRVAIDFIAAHARATTHVYIH